MKYNTKDELELIYRRTFIITCAKLFGFFVLICRLFKLQILDFKHYHKLSTNNSQRIQYLLAKRGDILDRNSIPLTLTVNTKKILYTPANKIDANVIKKTIQLFKKIPKNLDSHVAKIVKSLKRNSKHGIIIKKSLTREEIMNIEYNLVYLPGIEIREYSTRHYTLHDKALHIIGIVSKLTDLQLKKIQNLERKKFLMNSDIKIGVNGLEKTYNQSLEGTYGTQIYNIDAFGDIGQGKELLKPIDGMNLTITIDKKLQVIVADELNNLSGAISLIDINTGEILAMHSSPSFDPNVLVKGVDEDEWNTMISDKNTFLNKNISLAYPPGSIFKSVIALAALEGSVISPKTLFDCNGEYRIGNRVFHCWKKEGHGKVNMVESLSQSCNCYFYHLSTLLDIDDIYNMAIKLGLGAKYDIGLESEVSGIIPNKKWKKQHTKQSWYPGDTANVVIGQGFLETTPLQLLVMISRIATGKKIMPTLIKDDYTHKPLELNNMDNLDILRMGLFMAINDPKGTVSRHKNILNQNITACGKTGSSQIISRRIEHEEKSKLEERGHAIFVGYAPFDNPRFAITALIEHGFAGVRAANVALKVFNEIYKIYA